MILRYSSIFQEYFFEIIKRGGHQRVLYLCIMSLCPDIQRFLYLRPENGYYNHGIELEVNEICAICDDEFADEEELKDHVNKIHRLSTGPKKPSRSAPAPKRLANQLFEECDTFKNSKFKSY